MVLAGVDLGTTHCKAGLFDREGTLIRRTSRPTVTHRTAEGYFYHDPEELWETAASAIHEVMADASGATVEVVGVTSMAEAGVLVDRRTGDARTHVLPWYDARAMEQAEAIAREETPPDLFARSGLYPSFKYGLPKLLWLRERDAQVTEGALWLSVADYVVYRLTGQTVTDPSLAARTYAFRITEGAWDEAWIRYLGLEPDLFPPVLPAGTPAGTVTAESARATGLPAGTRVAVAGHDHICTLLAAGITEPGPVLDSIGTAESLIGVLGPCQEGGSTRGRSVAGERERESGLSLAPHVLPGRYCWVGGLSAAGGSIEWIRGQLAEQPLPYGRLSALIGEAGMEPTGILYFPYLSGSGAPQHDQRVRAAFIGLGAAHGRGDIVKAVLEGTAYEMESIRRSAERMTGRTIDEAIAVGGGVRWREWLQIKADVSGCRFHVPPLPEATVLGAALTAALGSGVVSGLEEVVRLAARRRDEGETVLPDPERHRTYRQLYETAYVSFQKPLRRRSTEP